MIKCAQIQHFNVLIKGGTSCAPCIMSFSFHLERALHYQPHSLSSWQSGCLLTLEVVLTFCGIWARAEAMRLAFSSVRFLTIDPRENTTMPYSPELWTNSSISCSDKITSITKVQGHSGKKFNTLLNRQSQEKYQTYCYVRLVLSSATQNNLVPLRENMFLKTMA